MSDQQLREALRALEPFSDRDNHGHPYLASTVDDRPGELATALERVRALAADEVVVSPDPERVESDNEIAFDCGHRECSAAATDAYVVKPWFTGRPGPKAAHYATCDEHGSYFMGSFDADASARVRQDFEPFKVEDEGKPALARAPASVEGEGERS